MGQYDERDPARAIVRWNPCSRRLWLPVVSEKPQIRRVRKKAFGVVCRGGGGGIQVAWDGSDHEGLGNHELGLEGCKDRLGEFHSVARRGNEC